MARRSSQIAIIGSALTWFPYRRAAVTLQISLIPAQKTRSHTRAPTSFQTGS